MEFKNLQLSLKKQWFDMTKSGIKTEDYREITPYWCNRFIQFRYENKSVKWWNEEYFFIDGTPCDILEIVDNILLFCSFKKFNHNVMTLGYPKSTDTEKILKFKNDGIEIGYGKSEWGADPKKLYFIVKHGEKIS
jgi:hypothetical protein